MNGYVVNVDCDNYNSFIKKIRDGNSNSSQILHAMSLTYVVDNIDFNNILVGKTQPVVISPVIYNCAQLLCVTSDDFFNRLIFDYVCENDDIVSNINFDYFLKVFYGSQVVYG